MINIWNGKKGIINPSIHESIDPLLIHNPSLFYYHSSIQNIMLYVEIILLSSPSTNFWYQTKNTKFAIIIIIIIFNTLLNVIVVMYYYLLGENGCFKRARWRLGQRWRFS